MRSNKDVKSIITTGIVTKNFYLTKLFYHTRFLLQTYKKPILLVYQMGKVGSTSILQTLKNVQIKEQIFQIHVLSSEGIEYMERQYFGRRNKRFLNSQLPETRHLFCSYFLRNKILKGRSKNIKVISLVRDPIARNVSEFFYSIDFPKQTPYLPGFYGRNWSEEAISQEIGKRFLEVFNESSDEYQFPLRWFDQEIKSVLHIDVYSSTFPKHLGYKLYNSEIADMLLIKLEMLEDVFPTALGKFLGIQNIKLASANRALTKKYYPVYKRFLEVGDIPEQYLRKVYSSKYMRHFYGEKEINKFIKRWNKTFKAEGKFPTHPQQNGTLNPE